MRATPGAHFLLSQQLSNIYSVTELGTELRFRKAGRPGLRHASSQIFDARPLPFLRYICILTFMHEVGLTHG